MYHKVENIFGNEVSYHCQLPKNWSHIHITWRKDVKKCRKCIFILSSESMFPLRHCEYSVPTEISAEGGKSLTKYWMKSCFKVIPCGCLWRPFGKMWKSAVTVAIEKSRIELLITFLVNLMKIWNILLISVGLFPVKFLLWQEDVSFNGILNYTVSSWYTSEQFWIL